MSDSATKPFGGVAGRVLREAISFGTLISGFALMLPVALVSMIVSQTGGEGIIGPIVQSVVTLALARFALNGYAGQWRGTVFSPAGGGTKDVVRIATRYSLLNSVWLVPLMLVGFRPEQTAGAVGAAFFGLGDGKALSLGALFIAGMGLSPPIFLIASVAASNVVEIFLPSHWERLFRGRWGDLFLVYVVYLGGVAMAILLALPLGVMLGAQSPKLAMAFGGAGVLFVAGLAVSLLGRLCGFFAAETGCEEEEEEFDGGLEPIPDLGLVGSGTSPAPSGPKTPLFRGLAALSGAAAERSPMSLLGDDGAAATRPALTNAPAQVEQAMRRFEADPSAAIAALEALESEHAPNPVVLHALCVMLERTGRGDDARALARRAIPLCLQRGSQKQAAELYSLLATDDDGLDVPPAHLLRIANTLRAQREYESAGSVYARLIRENATDVRAVKGMMQVAEAHLHQGASPSEALQVYGFLLEHCSESPLAEFMRDGQAEAERRLARG